MSYNFSKLDNVNITDTDEDIQMTAEDKKFFEQMDYYKKHQDHYGLKTVWSMYEDDTFGGTGEPIWLGKPSPIPQGSLIQNKCSVWGYDCEAVVGGTGTWQDVWIACDAAIRNARNDEGNPDHHIYIEGFERVEPGVWRVVTGS